ncbi:MAG: cyclically-permuted mutarotase family protein [Muribaculaceae bacterium]
MFTIKRFGIIAIFASALLAASCSHAPQVAVFDGFPADEPGYEQGVSACFAHAVGNALIMAGGANFAEVPAAEGGTKCFYSGIYMASLKGDALQWQRIGSLPEPLAYGVSLPSGDSLIVAGGSNAQGAKTGVMAIKVVDGKAHVGSMPPLPVAIDNAAGCVSEGVAYIVGGNANGMPSAAVYSLNLADRYAAWQQIATMPEARVQPVCAVVDRTLYVFGGFMPAQGDSIDAEVYTSGIAINLDKGSCKPMPAPVAADGSEVTLSGGVAVAGGKGTIVAAGGVNHDIFLDAISGSYRLIAKDDYLKQQPEWYRFNKTLYVFNTATMQWSAVGEYASLARAGAALVAASGNVFYCVGGEEKPGIRAAEVSRIEL